MTDAIARHDGLYWVRIEDNWTIALLENGQWVDWIICEGLSFRSDAEFKRGLWFDEIGSYLPPPLQAVSG